MTLLPAAILFFALLATLGCVAPAQTQTNSLIYENASCELICKNFAPNITSGYFQLTLSNYTRVDCNWTK